MKSDLYISDSDSKNTKQHSRVLKYIKQQVLQSQQFSTNPPPPKQKPTNGRSFGQMVLGNLIDSNLIQNIVFQVNMYNIPIQLCQLYTQE